MEWQNGAFESKVGIEKCADAQNRPPPVLAVKAGFPPRGRIKYRDPGEQLFLYGKFSSRIYGRWV